MALKLLLLCQSEIPLRKSTVILTTFCLLLALLPATDSFGQRHKKNKKQPERSAKSIAQEAEYLFIEAEKLYILKNYAQATEVLNKCLALQPDNDVVYYKLAEISNLTEQFSEAEKYITQAIRLNKTNKYYYLLAVDIYTNLGNLPEAAANYEQLIKIVPRADSYLFSLAAVYLYMQDYDKALATYDRAEKAFGLTEEISYQKQKIFLQQNNLAEAIKESKRLIARYPANSNYVLNLVEILSSNGRYEEAVTELQQLLTDNPDYAVARLQLADIYWKQQAYEKFGNELKLAFNDKALNLNAKINTVMKYLAYLPDTHLNSLIPQLVDILVVQHPHDHNAYLITGDVYGTLLDKKLVPGEEIEAAKNKAADAYARFVNLDPSNFAVWQNLLNLELQLNRQDSLAVHAKQALELYPNQAWLYLVNGIVQMNKKNNRQAALMLEMGRKRSGSNKGLLVMFYSYLGDIYNALQEYKKSDEAYEAALELDPLNFVVLNNYSYYLSLRGENLDKAKKMSTTLIRNNPDNNTYLDTYAWVHYTLGDYEEANRIFEKIIASGVNEGVYYDHYGDTLYKLGKPDEAVKQWIKARELDKNIENIDQKISQRKIIQ